MTGHDRAIVFDFELALQNGSGQVADRAEECTGNGNDERRAPGKVDIHALCSKNRSIDDIKEGEEKDIGDDAADQSFYGFLGADGRTELMLSEGTAGEICAAVGDPCAGECEYDIDDTVLFVAVIEVDRCGHCAGDQEHSGHNAEERAHPELCLTEYVFDTDADDTENYEQELETGRLTDEYERIEERKQHSGTGCDPVFEEMIDLKELQHQDDRNDTDRNREENRLMEEQYSQRNDDADAGGNKTSCHNMHLRQNTALLFIEY